MPDLGADRPSSVAFYLPQYHPIPENNAWWGEGFTDWVNVQSATPRFPGHAQPHVPLHGTYDPREDAVRERQAALAQQFGVDAFCYYHYWFNGHRLLHQPVDRLLESGVPGMPFLLAWANENWTRRWDGKNSDVLMEQVYSEEDDLAHIRSLLPVFADPRYATINGRPIFLVYQALLLPDPIRTTDRWRSVTVSAGLAEPFLVRMESTRRERGDPRALGFDAAVDFEPHQFRTSRAMRVVAQSLMVRARLTRELQPGDSTRSYERYARARARMGAAPYPRFPGITPGWDNTARRKRGAQIFTGSTPELYQSWLEAIVSGPLLASAPAPVVFVNAWNEWAEGAHLEPCERWGLDYLGAHARGLGRRDDEGRR